MKKLSVDDLCFKLETGLPGFTTTNDIDPATDIVGQPKAVKALKFGLSIHHDGYNIFVTGLSGTGRMTTLESMLADFSAQKETPPDICFVHNFQDPVQPTVLFLPAGTGKTFAMAMRELVIDLKDRIPAIFEDQSYKDETKKIISSTAAHENEKLVAFEKQAAEAGFKMVTQRAGNALQADILPVVGEQVLSIEDARTAAATGKITEDDLKQMIATRDELMEGFNRMLVDLEKEKASLNDRLKEFNKRVVMPVFTGCINRVKDIVGETVEDHLDGLIAFVDEHIYPFLDALNSDASAEDLFPEFSVNVAVDNGATEGAPVVLERNPSAMNLFGDIDASTDAKGRKQATFLEVRAGSLLKANGGYLVFNAVDIFQSGGDVWAKLKRTMKNKLLQIERETRDLLHSITLKPAPVPIQVKVIILGDEGLYYLLYSQDDEFKKIFKVLAEFGGHIDIGENNLKDYLQVLRKICHEEDLLPFSRDAVLELLNESVRMTEDRNKLTARFHLIADLMRESSFHARSRGAQQAEASDVVGAIQQRESRFNLLEERSLEFYREGTLLIETDGEQVGQVNGLAVHNYEFHAFGTPNRITARVSLGSDGLVNIEREAELSGNIHDKGVLILNGYLQGTYGRNLPLSINASICFEQSYGGVDGDSASSTELYALLSAIGNLPIRQDLAVTGSVNQHGEIQPVGGVNHKIEGFFRVCRDKGLTGTQGVIVPSTNVRNLNLRKDVLDAVEAGKFHIYSVETVEEGIQLLTGLEAGDIQTDGTVHHRVYQALSDFAGRMKEFNS